MIMIRREEANNPESHSDRDEKIVGVIEIPLAAEIDSVVPRETYSTAAGKGHIFARRAATSLPPATILRVDLVNLLNELEAELRQFHDRARRSV